MQKLCWSFTEKKGTEFLNQIDGSFAIAIWDGVEKKLLLARDRVGFKPLFYAKSDGSFLFGSEIKSLLASKLCPRSVNLQALNNFLSYGYVCNPETMFESIFQVKPGHFLIFRDGESVREALLEI